MKFTLKDYQADAVRDVLNNLKKARKRWHEDKDKHAFSLTAVTGAGKTVMAAAALEVLFHGDDDVFNFDADPGAVVIWFSDDPSLNEQTRFRLLEASDKLSHTDLVVVENTFSRPKFEPKKIYFLNTQKLGKKSLLVRGHDPEEGDGRGGWLFPETRPDLRSHTIWDTIRNTIEDPALTLYLVLDEAHRGMGSSAATPGDRSTIIKRLINGAHGVPGVPVVLGISATVERFNRAIDGMEGHTKMLNVFVDPAKVQESGLLKDTIILDIPDATGHLEAVLVRRATDKLRESTEAWADYAKQQDDPHVVVPLMVLQVPNSPKADDIGRALDTIFQQWPQLPRDSIANVFGEHATEKFGPYSVPYVSPERVHESTWVRVLIAKDAISTGWDCPRAEVMVSFRPAQDPTHITQLLGRMVRTPLARRIPGNERLNSVDCLLPFFDARTVVEVADALMKGGVEGDTPPMGRVLVNPVEMKPDPAVPETLWERFESLPSQTRPQRGARPSKRLTALAHELAVDELLPDAGKKAHAEMHKVLDAARARYREEISAARDAVMTVEGRTLIADLKQKSKTFNQFWEDADVSVITDAYRRAARVISPDVARSYAHYIAQQTANEEDVDDFDEAVMEARVTIAALAMVPEVQPYFDSQADELAKAWFNQFRVRIKSLPHDRQEAYRLIREMSVEPQDVDLVRPESTLEKTAVRMNATVTPLPTYRKHLLCDQNGNYPAELNPWEIEVLDTESRRDGFRFWYRNPQHPGQSSLGIAYLDGAEYKVVRPDFVFFAQQKNEELAIDIVDPHSTHLADALPKLQGLAAYAASHAGIYRRIEAVAEAGGKLRVLDLTREDVRKEIASAREAKILYEGEFASDFK